MADDKRHVYGLDEQTHDPFLLEPIKVENAARAESADRLCSIYCKLAVSAAPAALFGD